jgi:hypothetical protein
MTTAVGGIITVRANGAPIRAKGSFTYNLGRPMREAVVGADGVHGYRETPQVAFIEGTTTDKGDLDLSALVGLTDATVMLELANRKTVVLAGAWFAGEGSATTEEGEVAVRFEGVSAEELRAQ